jgi:membrane fusion protein, adhesin transport system
MFRTLRNSAIRALGGSALLENVTDSQADMVFAGRITLPTPGSEGLVPWSGRIRTDRPARRLIIVAAFLLAFLAWATLCSVDKVTRGAGRVLPSVQNQIVQHLEGGIVSDILVSEGQQVRKGDVLVRISNADTGAAMQTVQTDVVAKRIILARLDAEISGAATFRAPPEMVAQAPEIAASEEGLFQSRRVQRMQQAGIIGEQTRGRFAEATQLRVRLQNLRREEALAGEQLAKLEAAFREEAISEREVLEKRASLLALRTRIADVENQIPQTSASISESEAKHGEIWTHQIEDAKQLASQLRLELAKAGEQYGAVQDRVSREEIRAPMDGVVNKLYIQTVGGVIRAGEPVVEIVPLKDAVMFEARILPRDRSEIWPGLAAHIRISAYDASQYGTLKAKVADVSPDVLQDSKGEVFYRVRLTADRADFGKGKDIVPGMTGDVAISAGNQTILSYIIGPLVQIRDNALRE